MSASVPVQYDAAVLLSRAIRRLARHAGFPVRIAEVAARDWWSATFTGLAQTIILIGPKTPDFMSWLKTLGEAEFSFREHVVADLLVVAITDEPEGRRVVLRALTLTGV